MASIGRFGRFKLCFGVVSNISGKVKGTVHQKRKYIFSLALVVLFIKLDSFGLICLILEILAVYCRFLPSL